MSVQFDVSKFALIIERQEMIMKTQEKTIESLKSVVESQRSQIERQSELIMRLAAECDIIGKSSTEIAKKAAEKEVGKFKREYLHEVKDLKRQVTALAETNRDLDSRSQGMQAVAIAVAGYAAIALLVL